MVSGLRRSGDEPAADHDGPSATWVHQICRDTGVSATEALLLVLAEDKPFWRTIAMAAGRPGRLRLIATRHD